MRKVVILALFLSTAFIAKAQLPLYYGGSKTGGFQIQSSLWINGVTYMGRGRALGMPLSQGGLIYDTVAKMPYYHNGTVWTVFGSGSLLINKYHDSCLIYNFNNIKDTVCFSGGVGGGGSLSVEKLSDSCMTFNNGVKIDTFCFSGGSGSTIDTVNKWVQEVESNVTGDSLIVTKNALRKAFKYPVGYIDTSYMSLRIDKALLPAKDFIITADPGNSALATAIGYNGRTPFRTGSAREVWQRSLDELRGNATTGGGHILGRGLTAFWDSAIFIKGPGTAIPDHDIIITGENLNFLTGATASVIDISNGAAVQLRDFSAGVLFPGGKQAINIHKDSITGATEVAIWRGYFDNIKVSSSSDNSPTFYMENFFGVTAPKIDALSANKSSIVLNNNSAITNFGNSHFGLISAQCSDHPGEAAVKITSTNWSNGNVMNLNTFVQINTGNAWFGPGQTNGTGLLIDYGAYNIVNYLDGEYTPTTVYVKNGRENKILNGYYHPDGGSGLGIKLGPGANSNYFAGTMATDGPLAKVVSDSTAIGSTPNEYKFSFEGSANRAQMFIVNDRKTKVEYKINGSDSNVVELAGLNVKDFLKLSFGSLGAGKVLTSDAFGNATWQASAASGWGLTGNTGTTFGTNYIGTSDNKNIEFRINNQRAGMLYYTNPGNEVIAATSFGFGALSQMNVTPGPFNNYGNSAFGYQALGVTVNSFFNTSVGASSLGLLSTGGRNTAIGSNALGNLTTESYNTALGFSAGNSATAVTNTTSIGYDAQPTKSNQIVLGNNSVTELNFNGKLFGPSYAAGAATGTPAYNITVDGAGNFLSTPLVGFADSLWQSAGLGTQALAAYTTPGSGYNTAVGFSALRSNGVAVNNTAIGTSALRNHTTGSWNTAIGSGALVQDILGIGNTAVGYKAMNISAAGNNNSALGKWALINTVGNNNIGLGVNAGAGITGDGTLFISDSVTKFKLNLQDAALTVAPNVMGVAADGYVKKYSTTGNAVLSQSYTTGGSVTIDNYVGVFTYDPEVVESTATIMMPANIVNNSFVYITFGGTIPPNDPVVTTLTIAANTGQTLYQSITPTSANGGNTFCWFYSNGRLTRIIL